MAQVLGESRAATTLALESQRCDGTRHTSHITHHTSHITHHTSHITHHTSHITHHTSSPLSLCLQLRCRAPAPHALWLQGCSCASFARNRSLTARQVQSTARANTFKHYEAGARSSLPPFSAVTSSCSHLSHVALHPPPPAAAPPSPLPHTHHVQQPPTPNCHRRSVRPRRHIRGVCGARYEPWVPARRPPPLHGRLQGGGGCRGGRRSVEQDGGGGAEAGAAAG